MSWAFLVWFAFLLPAFSEASNTIEVKEVLVSTVFDKMVLNGSSGECGWKCTFNASDYVLFGNKTRHLVSIDGRLFKIRVRYELKVDDKCIKQTPRSSNLRGTKQWQVRLIKAANEDVPSFLGNALKNFSTFIEKEFLYTVNVSCTQSQFGANIPATSRKRYRELPLDDFQETILRLTHLGSLGNMCRAKEENNNQQSCIKISEMKYERAESWLYGAMFWFLIIFAYISPAVVGLYCATEVTHKGIRHIIVNGASPVGFRSLIGNYFFSTDHTTWNMAKRFIMHVFVLPIPFLLLALFVEYLLYNNVLPRQNSLSVSHLLHPFKILCYSCYCIHAFYLYLVVEKPIATSSCVVYPHHTLTTFCFASYLFASMCNRIFIIFVVPFEFIKDGHAMRPPCLTFTGYVWFIIRLLFRLLKSMCSFIPFIAFMVFTVYFGGFWCGVMFFVPISTLCRPACLSLLCLKDSNFYALFSLTVVQVVVALLDICISFLAVLGGLFVLKSAALGLLLIFQIAVTVVYSEENLPFVACLVLVSYYSWSSYSSFTNKYQDLAVALYHKQHPVREQRALHKNPDDNEDNESLLARYCNKTGQWDTENYDLRRIPKELFNMACTELMPVRENTRKLVSKVTSCLIFLFLVLLFTILLEANALKKTLVMFFAGLVPRIITFYFDKSRKTNVNLDTLPTDVLMYGESTFFTDQTQGNRPAGRELDEQLNVGIGVFNLLTFTVLFCLFLNMAENMGCSWN